MADYFSYPDAEYSKTVGSTDDQLALIREVFGPNKTFQLNVDANMPIEASTLASAYGDGRQNNYIKTLLRRQVEAGNGWWFELCPLQRSEELVKRWSIINWKQYALEPAPEDTAPRYVTYSREEGVDYLTRLNLGAKAHGDFFKTAGGRAEMAGHYQTIVFGAWAAARIMAGAAATGAKNYWQEWNAKFGNTYTNVMDAMDDEVRLFLALHDEQGFYKLNSYVKKETQKANPGGFDMAVVGNGCLDWLAYSNKYELEASRRGASVVEDRLMGGGKAFRNMFGVTVYEDVIFNLENVGQDEFEQFHRIAIIGRYFMIDGSDFGENWPNYPALDALSVKAASMDVDDYKLITILDAIDNNQRFGPDDKTSPRLSQFARDAPTMLQQLGMKLHHDDYLDPYIFRDLSYRPSGSDAQDFNNDNGYHVIKQWGDMDPYYFTLKQMELHGRHAANLLKRELLPREIEALSYVNTLRDSLYNVESITNDSFRGYAFAVTANPENRTPGARDFSRHSPSSILKPNRHGCVFPPYVDHSPKRHGTSLKRKMISPEVELPNGVMYVQQGDKKLYVWAVRAEAVEETIVLDSNDMMVRNPENPSEILKEYEDFWAQQDTNRVQLINDALVRGVSSAPYMYVLAPLDYFGQIHQNGEAVWFNTTMRDNDIRTSIAHRIMRKGKKVNEESVKGFLEAGAVPPGWGSVRLVEATSLPFGFGTISGIRTLGQMYGQGNTRGWNETAMQQAHYGAIAEEKAIKACRKFYPDCSLFNEKYAPYWMLIDDEKYKEQNEDYAVLANLFDHTKYSFWTKIPVITKATNSDPSYGSGIMVQFCQHDGETETPGGDVVIDTLSDDFIKTLLYYMGFSNIGAGFGNVYIMNTVKERAVGPDDNLESVDDGDVDHQVVVNRADLTKVLKLILGHRDIDPNIKNILQNYRGTSNNAFKVFKAYSEGGFLGQAYSDLLRVTVDGIEPGTKFAWFFLKAIVEDCLNEEAELNARGATNTEKNDALSKYVFLFNTFVGLAHAASQGSTKKYTASAVNQLINKAKEVQKKRDLTAKSRKKIEEIDETRGGGGGNTLHYINTRLAISEKPFAQMFSVLDSVIDPRDKVAAVSEVAFTCIRPSDPSDQSKPLADTPIKPLDILNPDNDVAQNLTPIRYARAVIPTRMGIESTILSHHGLMSSTGREGQVRREKRQFERYIKESAFDPFTRDPKKRRLPPQMVNDVDGPMYGGADDMMDGESAYEDDSYAPSSAGRVRARGNGNKRLAEDDGVYKLFKKKNLIARFNHLSETVSDDLTRICAQMLCFTNVTRTSLRNWVQKGLPIPDSCVLFVQPWIRIKTSAGLWAKSGGAAGNTYYGHEDATLTYNGMHKTWLVHFTIWMGCSIIDTTKIFMVKDIKAEGYQGGMDDTIMDDPDSFDPVNIDFATVKSTFVFSCGANFSREDAIKYCNPLSIYGKYDRRQLMQNFADRNRIFSPDGPLFPSFPFYNYVWRFDAINSEATLDMTSFTSMKESTYLPGLAPMATHLAYDIHTGQHTKKIKGTGHLDKMEPPMRAVLAGKIRYEIHH